METINFGRCDGKVENWHELNIHTIDRYNENDANVDSSEMRIQCVKNLRLNIYRCYMLLDRYVSSAIHVV